MELKDRELNGEELFILKYENGEEVEVSLRRSETPDGTLINKANLETALSQKQKKLQGYSGINIDGENKVSCTAPLVSDYTAFVPQFTSSSYEIDNNSSWSAITLDATNYERGKQYLMQLGDGPYKTLSVEFELENVSFNTSIDGDPTIAIKFEGNSRDDTVYCLYRIVSRKVRLIKDAGWSQIGQSSETQFEAIQPNKSYKIRIVRGKKVENKYTYSCYFDGICMLEVTSDVNKLANVKVGTIGCKANKIKNWKINGTY